MMMVSAARRMLAVIMLSAGLLATITSHSQAQGPMGRSFGIGFSVGEPTAVSARFWTSRANSWDLAVGHSYLGNPHIHADYLWHFNDAFNSRIVSLYAGIGGIVGFGDRGDYWFVRYSNKNRREYWYYHDDNSPVFAVKGAFGLNIIPRNTPLDIFLEVNPVLGIAPGFGFDIMPAVGIRFYP